MSTDDQYRGKGMLGLLAAVQATETPAETLRRAAAQIRRRAEAATPGPWYDAPHGARRDCRCVKTGAAGRGRDHGEFVAMYVTRDAEHIAAADPPFVLAVAVWLEESADHLDVAEDEELDPALLPHVCPTAREGLECSVLNQALSVARTYLGEVAP